MFYNKIMSSDIKGNLSLLTSHLLPLKKLSEAKFKNLYLWQK